MILQQTMKKERQRGKKCRIRRLLVDNGNVYKFRRAYSDVVYLKDKLSDKY